jgi:hypothetical protein
MESSSIITNAMGSEQSTSGVQMMLSELAFTSETAPASTPATSRTSTAASSSSNDGSMTPPNNNGLTLWHGIFCPSTDDEEQFFDALEDFSDHGDEQQQRHGSYLLDRTIYNVPNGGAFTYDEEDSFSTCPAPPRHGRSDYSNHAHTYQKKRGGYKYNPPMSPRNQGYEVKTQRHSSSVHNDEEKDEHALPKRNVIDVSRTPPPAPPEETPVRFLRAGKDDPVEGTRRYQATLKWRKENAIDTILVEPHFDFELIKQHYPHYYHLQGHDGQPVFFELPPRTNLAALRLGGVNLKKLLHHYAMVTEFQWQWLDRDDFSRSITVIDLQGMRMTDFVGECVDYVRKCSEFTSQNYPERAGFVMVVNVPGWFKMIWNVVKPMIDEVTLKKIQILRGKEEIFRALLDKIPIQNIPPEYGGQSMPLGQAPQETLLRDLMRHNNNVAKGDHSCGGKNGTPPCRFCIWEPARGY